MLKIVLLAENIRLTKMILLDALYINNSGGFRLLKYLVSRLKSCNEDFYLLADARCYGEFDDCKFVRYMNASIWERNKFYKAKGKRFSTILCFGNIPAPAKLDATVYTYFHNINLLTLSESRSVREYAAMWLKRQVFRHYKKNTDKWLVQTANTKSELCKHLSESENRVKIIPFYEMPEELGNLANKTHGDDYVFVSNYTGAKGHEELLEAWRLLHKNGYDKTLHLTVPSSAVSFCETIGVAQKDGVNVINHGLIPFDQVKELYKKSKAIVYPSHNESLGLGLIEAIEAGCDVIASDLPFTYSVCKPSVAFDPYSPESIADAVMQYEKGRNTKSELLVSNKIDELIELLVKNEK